MSDYYVSEDDGQGHYVLEDGSGNLILEAGGDEIAVPFISAATVVNSPSVGAAGQGRITQAPIEVLVLPSDQKARITQMAIEVLVRPEDTRARLTQAPIEVLIQNVYESVDFWIIEYGVDTDAT